MIATRITTGKYRGAPLQAAIIEELLRRCGPRRPKRHRGKRQM